MIFGNNGLLIIVIVNYVIIYISFDYLSNDNKIIASTIQNFHERFNDGLPAHSSDYIAKSGNTIFRERDCESSSG